MDLPAAPLGQAINTLAQQSRYRPFSPSDLGAGPPGSRAEGRFTPEEALRQLLRDSGLKRADPGRTHLHRRSRQRTRRARYTASPQANRWTWSRWKSPDLRTSSATPGLRHASPPSSSMPNWRSAPGLRQPGHRAGQGGCRGCPIQDSTITEYGQTLRGRSTVAMVDGVPLNTNRDPRATWSTSTRWIERIEVIPWQQRHLRQRRHRRDHLHHHPSGRRREPRRETRLSATSPADLVGQRWPRRPVPAIPRRLSWGARLFVRLRHPSRRRFLRRPWRPHRPGTQPGRPVRLERLQHRRASSACASTRTSACSSPSRHYDARQDTDYATDPRVARLPPGSVLPTRSKAWSWTSRTESATPWRTSSTRTSTSSAAGSPRSSTTATISPASPVRRPRRLHPRRQCRPDHGEQRSVPAAA